jgi:hypothetical protein
MRGENAVPLKLKYRETLETEKKSKGKGTFEVARRNSKEEGPEKGSRPMCAENAGWHTRPLHVLAKGRAPAKKKGRKSKHENR